MVALHASFLGVEVESLAVEVTGRFDPRACLGIEEAAAPGFGPLSCAVQLRARGITPDQIAYLRRRCVRSLPVADTLARPIPLELTLEAAIDPPAACDAETRSRLPGTRAPIGQT